MRTTNVLHQAIPAAYAATLPAGTYHGMNGALWYYNGIRWWKLATSGPESFPDGPVEAGGTFEAVSYVNTDVLSGDTVADTSDATAFASSYTVLGSTMGPGTVLRATICGVYGTTGTPTLALTLKYASTTVLTTGAITMPSSVTDVPWSAEFLIVGHTTGFEVQGTVRFRSTATATLTICLAATSEVLLPAESDSGDAFTLVADWSAQSSSNTITMRTMMFEALA